MPLDLTSFHPLFFEETAEHLATMELMLLHLDPQAPDPALLEDIGRAAHSIKGAGATVGFADITRLAEEVTASVDGVRKGRQPLSAALIQALRDACRALRAQLAGHRGEDDGADEAAARAGALLRRLSAGLPDPGEKVSPRDTAAAPGAPAGSRRAGEVMALLEAAGAGDLRQASAAVRALGEAIERNAALAEEAVAEAEALRESFHALVGAIAGLAMSSATAAPPARRRPLPKVRRRPGAGASDTEWPEF